MKLDTPLYSILSIVSIFEVERFIIALFLSDLSVLCTKKEQKYYIPRLSDGFD